MFFLFPESIIIYKYINKASSHIPQITGKIMASALAIFHSIIICLCLGKMFTLYLLFTKIKTELDEGLTLDRFLFFIIPVKWNQ